MKALISLVLPVVLASASAGETPSLAISPPVAIAPDGLRDGALLQSTPAVAFGKKVYLVAWSDGSRMLGKETADICCARVEPDGGKSLDPKGIVVCRAENLQGRPAVAFDGTNFLVVWQDLRNGTDYDLYAARVTEEGKVLDPSASLRAGPDGFPVVKRPSNQAWPTVAFAAGNYVVAWMDARQYPVYGIYFARVSPEGKVLDPEGLPADAEDPAKIAKVKPAGPTWLGDKAYWWHDLASRTCPTAASNGASVLIVCVKEYPFAGSGRPGLAAAIIRAADGTVTRPVKVAGGPSPAWTGKGWALGGPAWKGGWTPTPLLGAAFLPETPVETKDPGATVDVVAAFGGGYNVGKGSTASFPSAAAFNGKNTLVAMQYAWREKGREKEPVFAILLLRVSTEGEFRALDEKPVAVATMASPSSVNHPALAAEPRGRWLLIYQEDTGVDRSAIVARTIKEEPQ